MYTSRSAEEMSCRLKKKCVAKGRGTVSRRMSTQRERDVESRRGAR